MQKSVEQRKQYVDHVRKMFVLAGEPEAQAAKDADTVMAIETRLAKASLTITEQRDPQNLNHPTDVAGLRKGADAFFAGRLCDGGACACRRQSRTIWSRSSLPSSMRW